SPAADAFRARQIDAILEHADRAAGSATILIGDLNAGPPVSMGNYRQVIERGYADLFADGAGAAAAATAVTWDSQQPLNRRGPHAHQRPQRIDHVFAKPRDAWRVAEARLVLTEPTVSVPGGNRVTVADHYGVYVRLAA